MTTSMAKKAWADAGMKDTDLLLHQRNAQTAEDSLQDDRA